MPAALTPTLYLPLQVSASASTLPPAGPRVSIPDMALHLSAMGYTATVRKVTDSKTYWTKSMQNR